MYKQHFLSITLYILVNTVSALYSIIQYFYYTLTTFLALGCSSVDGVWRVLAPYQKLIVDRSASR